MIWTFAQISMFRTRKSIKTIPYSSTAPKKTNFVGRWDAIVSHQADLYQFRIPSIGLTTTWGTLQNNKIYISTKHKSTRSSTIVKCAEHRTPGNGLWVEKKKKLIRQSRHSTTHWDAIFPPASVSALFFSLRCVPWGFFAANLPPTPALPRCRFHGGVRPEKPGGAGIKNNILPNERQVRYWSTYHVTVYDI